MNIPYSAEEFGRRALLCEECESEHCMFNPGGYCLIPLIKGEKAEITEKEGCLDYKLKEE